MTWPGNLNGVGMDLFLAWRRNYWCSFYVWNETYSLGRGRGTKSCSGFQPQPYSAPVDQRYHPRTSIYVACVYSASLCQLLQPKDLQTAPSLAFASPTSYTSIPLPPDCPVPSRHSLWQSQSLAADLVGQSSSASDTLKRSPSSRHYPLRVYRPLKFSKGPRSR